ncbi:glycosyltransferase [Arthrobacter sp. AFG20]|uniref:glycosyltransferase n=1 Tax=Arthrobacter sp. AFG20 TaxID=1688671 RepID=UPI000C9E454C|nr:glycosyltransferase [Arthrobacter sp. AFG20]PNH85215.1 glycosyltransferase [Arthrobacter sp. AFG20]
MRIIQIATLISPSGAYGGPIRVAVNQTRALLDAGHDVILAAGAQGFGRRLPKEYDGVPVTLFKAFKPVPKSGFSGLVAPGLQEWLNKATSSADVAHIHLGRDLITLPAASKIRRQNVPYVLQTHGMITPSSHPMAGTVDALWTKPALSNANSIFFLTPEERRGLSELAPTLSNLQELRNGVPPAALSPSSADNGSLEVLFLARLHARKRPRMFVSVAKALHRRYPHVRFSIVGPDEGEGTAVSAAIKEAAMGDALKWEGSLRPEDTSSRIARSNVYVLPSVDEPFPMSVLEALSLGKPVVVTDSCGLAADIGESKAGIVVDSSLKTLTLAVEQLIADAEFRKMAGQRAKVLAAEKFSMEVVCTQLERTYAAIARRA